MRDDCVDGDDIFDTGVAPRKKRHNRHHRHGEGWMRFKITVLPEWVRTLW